MLDATPSTPLLSGLIKWPSILLVCLFSLVISLPRNLSGPAIIATPLDVGIGSPNTLVARTLVVLPYTVTSLGRPKNPVNWAPVWKLLFLGVSLSVAIALLNVVV